MTRTRPAGIDAGFWPLPLTSFAATTRLVPREIKASATFLARWNELTEAVVDIVRDLGGSFSAEHGIGLLKVRELANFKSALEMDLMRSVKSALDPKGLMNPGKVL